MTLAVYRPDDSSQIVASIADAFEHLFLPHLVRHGRAADTISQYRRAVSLWSDWSQKYRTCHPVPVANVNSEKLERFRDWLVEDRRSSSRTANKFVAAIQAILAHCAARGTGAFAIADAPKIEQLPHSPAKAKLYVRFLLRDEVARCDALARDRWRSPADDAELAELRRRDELSRLYRACSAAYWPTVDRAGRRIDPVDHWRAAIVLLTLYGFRLGELIACKPKHDPLRWRNVSWGAETPAAGYHAMNAAGWIWYVPTKQRRLKSDPLVLPIHPVAADHLARIATIDDVADAPVFNWPQTKPSLYGVWSAIVAQAGLRPKRDLRSDRELRLRPEHLRKTCATWLNYHRPGLAPLVTGHAARDATLDASGSGVLAKHYDNSEATLVEAIASLPIPEAWRSASRDEQRLLF